ncbi:alpha/beta fold hydrolase [Micromonospora inyonensis]|uniref:Pimeloyl-ACP methyl ester carboxylesterase n=1 Tax=Micromonospora inyonensis TaxID=47866 RepID=A0A1C6RIL5_9ACTN|nr:alpha/beta hydrolase [Micromonospora inyonensis]SCL17021.1 Pimeloyl-ACP methyl ester carboxylesterase [Micromonospora inyonensis]
MMKIASKYGKADFTVKLPRAGITLRGWQTTGTDGPVTLCLHGVLDNCASFDPLREWTPGLGLVAIDLPGHGLSDPISSLTCSYLDYVAAILELLHEQSWDNVRLIGHSMGAALSTLIAGLFPDLVSRLVLIDAIGPMSATPAGLAMTAARYLRAYLADRPQAEYASVEQAVLARVQLADIVTDTAERLVERDLIAVPGGFSWRTDRRLKYPSAPLFSEEQVLEFIRAIRAPTLLVSATRTALVEDFYAGRIAAVQNLRHVRLPGSHHLHMENPRPVSAVIRQFLEEN